MQLLKPGDERTYRRNDERLPQSEAQQSLWLLARGGGEGGCLLRDMLEVFAIQMKALTRFCQA
jgi:hypothetical protein